MAESASIKYDEESNQSSSTDLRSSSQSSDSDSMVSDTVIGSSSTTSSTYDTESQDTESDISDTHLDSPDQTPNYVNATSSTSSVFTEGTGTDTGTGTVTTKNGSSRSNLSHSSEGTTLTRTSFYSNSESEEKTPISSKTTIYEHCSSSEGEEEDEDQRTFQNANFVAVCGDGAGEMHAQEPWPQDVKLFQPYEVEQIILPDNANCLAVQAYLKMCGLNFEVEPRHNAEYMSPSGRVPFIKCGAFVVSELDPIIGFISSKGISLSDKMDPAQKADMRAYMSLVNTVLANAELYVTWCDPTTLAEVTKPRYGSVYPWPLNHIINWQKGSQVKKRLAVLGWYQKSLKEVYAEVENCCNALSERLEKKDYFFGTSPTALDACVFGHLFAILTTSLPNSSLGDIVRRHSRLMQFVKRINTTWFNTDTPTNEPDLFAHPSQAEIRVLHQQIDIAEPNLIKKPTELDALVFGHLFTILTTPLPNNQFASIIRGYPSLIELIKRIEREYFERSDN